MILPLIYARRRYRAGRLQQNSNNKHQTTTVIKIKLGRHIQNGAGITFAPKAIPCEVIPPIGPVSPSE